MSIVLNHDFYTFFRRAKNGKQHALVELDPGEKLTTFNEDRFYRLGGQVEDMVLGHVITEADHVVWCSIGQEWVS